MAACDPIPKTGPPYDRRERAKPARICFGHLTALQILQPLDRACWRPRRARARTLPDHAPRAGELQRKLELLETMHADLRFEKPAHVLVGNPNCRASPTCKPHVHGNPLPSGSLLRLDRETTLTAPATSFVHLARQASETALLSELGWEMCGSYQTKRTGTRPAYQVEPLTSTRALRTYVTKNPSMGGARKVQRILPYLADGSACPRANRSSHSSSGCPCHAEGYGLGIPRMNYEVSANSAARAISGRRSFRCDLCWPEAKLDVEYQSREHHEGEVSRLRDSRRANALVAMGWIVIGVTNDELDSMLATDTIAASIRKRLCKRLQMRFPDHHARKLGLRRELAGCRFGFDLRGRGVSRAVEPQNFVRLLQNRRFRRPLRRAGPPLQSEPCAGKAKHLVGQRPTGDAMLLAASFARQSAEIGDFAAASRAWA